MPETHDESIEKSGRHLHSSLPEQELVQKHTPPEYRQNIILSDSSKAEIRPIVCTDKDALLAFHRRLSEETRFLRYHYLKGDLTEEDLKMYCELDYFNDLALVVEKEMDGRKDIIGVGRYSRLADRNTAEVAFVVQDDEQRKGIGSQLVKHLAVLAWARGIEYFVGEVFNTNAKMLSIFRRCDPHMVQIPDTTTCDIKLSVREAMNLKE